jgi:hypothetical protein
MLINKIQLFPYCCILLLLINNNNNSGALVRERTVPTEQLPFVDES